MFDNRLAAITASRNTHTPDAEMSPRELILAGRAPHNFRVRGLLDLSNSPLLRSLPPGLRADSLDLSNCTSLTSLPPGLRLKFLKLDNCSALRELPTGLQCNVLEFHNSTLRTLPPDLRVTHRLDLSGGQELRQLPQGLSVGILILRDCTGLERVPEYLDVYTLDISGCTALREWPTHGKLRYGTLRARGCGELRSLPPWLGTVTQVDLRDCGNLRALPETLQVGEWVDLAGTGITGLPPALDDLPLRWRGVPVDRRIAFQPETITAAEVLDAPNVERRRVLLERMGYVAFLREADAEELDRDEDTGGERRLLRVPQLRDEDLVCLAVYCPSTGRQYVLRVPPAMRSCRQGAAWIAGFDDADDFRPVAET